MNDVRWSIALLLTATAVGVYYALVLREDQRVLAAAEAEAPPQRPKRVVLLAPAGEGLRRELERLGSRVRHWERGDAGAAVELSGEQALALHERIAAVDSDEVVVIVDAEGSAEVVPYAVRG